MTLAGPSVRMSVCLCYPVSLHICHSVCVKVVHFYPAVVFVPPRCFVRHVNVRLYTPTSSRLIKYSAKAQTPLHGHRLRTCCATPPTDTINGRAHNNSTTNCHIAMPEPNISTCQDVRMWQIFVRWWWLCCTTSCELVRWWCSLVVSVAGVRVVEYGPIGINCNAGGAKTQNLGA